MGTISKAIELLDLFSRARPEIGLADFVRLTGRDKATIHRHLTELAQNGLLDQRSDTRAYRLGPAVLRFSAIREATHPFRAIIRPIVVDLSETVGELAHATLLQGHELSPVFHADPRRHGTRVFFDESEMLPLHATSSGLAVLAFGPEAQVENLIVAGLPRLASGTITAPETLRVALARTRKSGISRLANAFDDEVTSQGAPIFGSNGEVLGAISVAVPSSRASDAKLAAIRPHLRCAAGTATRSLGGIIPPHHTGKWDHTEPDQSTCQTA